MAQNSTKGLKAKAASGGRKNNGLTKKGQRSVAPKEAVRVMQAANQKVRTRRSRRAGVRVDTDGFAVLPSQKLSGKINKSIERQMVQAASAGKLTIMKGAGQDADATG